MRRTRPKTGICVAGANRIGFLRDATINQEAEEARLSWRNRGQPPGRQGQKVGQQADTGRGVEVFPARHGKNLWRQAQRNHSHWTLTYCSTSPERRIFPTTSG